MHSWIIHCGRHECHFANALTSAALVCIVQCCIVQLHKENATNEDKGTGRHKFRRHLCDRSHLRDHSWSSARTAHADLTDCAE